MAPRSGEICSRFNPAPTPNKRSRLSGVGYNGAPCHLRRLTVGGLTVTAPVIGVFAALPLPSSPYGSHLTGYTGYREDIPLI